VITDSLLALSTELDKRQPKPSADTRNLGIWQEEAACMDVNEYLRTFLAELHRLRPVPDYDECDHSIGLAKDGELEIRLSAGDIYKVALISTFDLDPVKAANQAASAPCKFTHPAAGHEIVNQPPLETDA
jgi:hypothetical protein